MSKLIEYILINNNNIKIKSFFGDGSLYDSNENFKYFQKKRIKPAIKVRKNSIISLAQDVQLYINTFYNNICIFSYFLVTIKTNSIIFPGVIFYLRIMIKNNRLICQ
jgi:hypothetical protein